ncbi:AAA family ATPase [Brevibacillus choshinensis]|uniref:AAA family ATPase n=1 Tax=Brevibacillus choshinensis TaxID=54911 RepID=UPI002E21F969|nr:AAA family ATPase [Brevibacillus choshinensis]MED4750233.1 AAA family ATPase [Brevibacillus choshinensis]
MESNILVESSGMPSSTNRIQVVFKRELPKKPANTLAASISATAPSELLSLFDELEGLVGLQEAKKTIYEIYALLKINKEREKHHLKQEKQVFHMVFKGNPGTGKTTVARLFGKMFREMGILSKGHLIEVERADLVGEFIGHTAQKTRDLVKKALGGILFIDEAYSLARGGEKDFGKEAVDCLTKALEDSNKDFICIIAGYNEEMENFLDLNPGLPSRFPVHITFDDYSVDELLEIANIMARNKDFEITKDGLDKIKRTVSGIVSDPFQMNFSNARFIRNCIEKAIRVQAVRLIKANEFGRDDLVKLKPEDFSI